jgi:hypothetical protein
VFLGSGIIGQSIATLSNYLHCQLVKNRTIDWSNVVPLNGQKISHLLKKYRDLEICRKRVPLSQRTYAPPSPDPCPDHTILKAPHKACQK